MVGMIQGTVDVAYIDLPQVNSLLLQDTYLILPYPRRMWGMSGYKRPSPMVGPGGSPQHQFLRLPNRVIGSYLYDSRFYACALDAFFYLSGP